MIYIYIFIYIYLFVQGMDQITQVILFFKNIFKKTFTDFQKFLLLFF